MDKNYHIIGIKMLDFTEIMARIKKILSEETGEKVYDKDIAKALGFKASYYAVIKRRHKIPYKAIALFADKNSLSLNWIFFNKLLPSTPLKAKINPKRYNTKK